MEAAPTVEQALVAANALFNDPAQSTAANEWLTALQAAPAAWSIAPEMLSLGAAAQVRFIGATMLYQKCRTDIQQLDAALRPALRDRLLADVVQHAAEGSTRNKLCQAAAALLVTCEEAGGLDALLTHPTFAAMGVTAMIEVLHNIPVELRDCAILAARRAGLEQQLQANMAQVLAFVQQSALAAWQSSPRDDATATASIAALRSWADLGCDLERVEQTPLYALLFEALRDENPLFCEGASEALVAIVGASKGRIISMGRGGVLLDNLATQTVAVRPAADAGEERWLWFCKCASAVGSAFAEAFGRGAGQGSLSLVEALLRCASHPSVAVSELALEFWAELATRASLESEMRAEAFGAATMVQLMQVCVQRAALPEDFEEWDSAEVEEGEWDHYRMKLRDTMIECTAWLRTAPTDALGVAQAALSAQGASWQQLEAALFAYSAVADAVLSGTGRKTGRAVAPFPAQVDAPLGAMLQWVLSSPAALAKPEIGSAAYRAIGAYAPWIVSQEAALLPTLRLLLPALSLPSDAGGLDAARAFNLICSRAGDALGTPASSQALEQSISAVLAEMLQAASAEQVLANSVDVRKQVVEGLARAVVCLPAAADTERAVGMLLEPSSSRLAQLASMCSGAGSLSGEVVSTVVTEVSVLARTVRFLGKSSAGATVHPAIQALTLVWEPLKLLALTLGSHTAVAEATADVCSAAIVSSREAAEQLLLPMMEVLNDVYGKSRCPACLLALAKGVEAFGRRPQMAEVFGAALLSVAQTTFAAAQSDIAASPELLSAFFDMLHRYQCFCPVSILESAALPTLVQFTAACLALRDARVARSLSSFLALCTEKGGGDARLLGALQPELPALVRALWHAVADVAPLTQVPKLADCLWVLSRGQLAGAAAEATQGALGEAAFPSQAQGVAHREQLLRCISKADTVQKFRAMLLDFARVCRGEADMDTLSKYEA